jgi:outer membrane protein OmpA-like peptidoglycan-associated protein
LFNTNDPNSGSYLLAGIAGDEPESKQTIKSPSAIIATGRTTGSDCKNYSLFTAGILDNINKMGFQKIPFCFRFTGYKFFDTNPQHVFIVAYPGTDHEIWCDAVLNKFDYKKLYTIKIDKKPKNILVGISGIGAKPKTFAGKILRPVLKVAASPARNAFLLLVGLNFTGLATKLNAANQKQPKALMDWWERLGGRIQNLLGMIERGAKKKRIFGIGLDPATDTAATAAVASPILAAVAVFLKVSSDGHPGFGGLDIIKAKIGEEGVVKGLEYLPEPLNSSHDDFGFIQSSDGKKGFISSDRFKQQDDIYAFDYDKKIVNMSGYVFSRFTETRKPGVKITIQNKLKDNSLIEEGAMPTDANGDFAFKGRPNNEYVLTIDNGGDDIQRIGFSTENVFDRKPLGIFYVDKKKEIVIETPKPKLDTTKFIIYFAFDKSSLTNKAKRILDKAAALVKSNPDLKAILDGHTDLWGGDKYNMDLSNKRVKEACKYFTKIGLSGGQTDCSQYYGKQRPVYNTLDRSVSVKNRRVEIFVTNK